MQRGGRRLNAVRKRLNFALMIHRIHGGKSQARYYTIYGYGNTPHNYNEIASAPLNSCTMSTRGPVTCPQ